MKISVCFNYDESSSKWEVEIVGTDSHIEAKQAFNAVVLTCKEVRIGLDHLVSEGLNNSFLLTPAV